MRQTLIHMSDSLGLLFFHQLTPHLGGRSRFGFWSWFSCGWTLRTDGRSDTKSIIYSRLQDPGCAFKSTHIFTDLSMRDRGTPPRGGGVNITHRIAENRTTGGGGAAWRFACKTTLHASAAAFQKRQGGGGCRCPSRQLRGPKCSSTLTKGGGGGTFLYWPPPTCHAGKQRLGCQVSVCFFTAVEVLQTDPPDRSS